MIYFLDKIISLFSYWKAVLEKKSADNILGVRRSPCWFKLTKQWKKEGKIVCAITGRTDDVDLHHIVPVNIDPLKECEETNIIPLWRPLHFELGHLGSWFSYNMDIVKDAEDFKNKQENRP